MDLTASQAADRAAAILQGLDADAKKAGDQAAVARAWLDLARRCLTPRGRDGGSTPTP
jgi:hypothetical protein